ncbi:hypothetical protein ACQPW3_24290 [Actinosynnema sp. CA-248983]
MRVVGTLRFPSADAPVRFDRVRVEVRDVSEADAPARTLAVVTLPAVDVPAGGLELPFAVDADVDGPGTFVVRAHGDRDGSGVVTRGDFVTTAAHRVTRVPMVVDLHPVDA